MKLGRAYLALRYPALAIAQAERRSPRTPRASRRAALLEEAKNPPRPAPGGGAPGASGERAGPRRRDRGGRRPAAPPPASTGSRPSPRPLREPSPAAAEARGGARARLGGGRGERAAPAAAERARTVAVTAVEGAPDPAAAPRRRGGPRVSTTARRSPSSSGGTSRGRTRRSPTRSRSTRASPWRTRRARAPASGSARYREAATDYRAALALDPGLGTPLYGLAECYRVLGDARERRGDVRALRAQRRRRRPRRTCATIAAKRAQELRGSAARGAGRNVPCSMDGARTYRTRLPLRVAVAAAAAFWAVALVALARLPGAEPRLLLGAAAFVAVLRGVQRRLREDLDHRHRGRDRRRDAVPPRARCASTTSCRSWCATGSAGASTPCSPGAGPSTSRACSPATASCSSCSSSAPA